MHATRSDVDVQTCRSTSIICRSASLQIDISHYFTSFGANVDLQVCRSTFDVELQVCRSTPDVVARMASSHGSPPGNWSKLCGGWGPGWGSLHALGWGPRRGTDGCLGRSDGRSGQTLCGSVPIILRQGFVQRRGSTEKRVYWHTKGILRAPQIPPAPPLDLPDFRTPMV